MRARSRSGDAPAARRRRARPPRRRTSSQSSPSRGGTPSRGPSAVEPSARGASADAGEAPREDEDPVNENRAGHLPTPRARSSRRSAEPEAPPTLVGRYSAGGANYMIFSDGSIEAETENGAFKFASMASSRPISPASAG